MRAPVEKRQRILDFLYRYISEHSYPPSIREIQVACGLSSTSVVDYHLRALEQAGHIRRRREASRAMELREPGRAPRTIAVPIIGTIAAGEPIPVPSADARTTDWAESVEVASSLLGGQQEVYALRVKGNSMVDALVGDGDLVVMAPAQSAENGDVVAAWLKREGEATLKRFYRERDRVRLQPANESMAPIYTDADNLEIQGKVILTLRQT